MLKEEKQATKCIRSFAVAQMLMKRGHIPTGTERSRRSKGFNVFLFDANDELLDDFEAIMQKIGENSNTYK